MELFLFIIEIQIFNSILMFGSQCLHFVLILYTRYYILSIRATPLHNPVNIHFQPYIFICQSLFTERLIYSIIIFLFYKNVFITGNI